MKKVDFSALKEKIHFYPHDAQKAILKGMGRFTVVNSAKRLGKTTLAAYLALRESFLPRHTTWIVGPNYELASRAWEYIEEWIDLYFKGEYGPFRINRHDKVIENMTTGSKILMKTTETPTGLLGKGLDFVVIDEAARVDNGIWEGYIRPNLMDKHGRALLISNPYGYNWFYEMYCRGLPEARNDNPDYISFHFPTAIEDADGNIIGSNNPATVKVDELKSIKAVTPRDRWIVEYLGEFREGAGQRFKGVDECVDHTIPIANQNEWFEPPIPGHLYYIGVDIGKLEDFTVICIIDRMTNRLVGFYRINQVRWEYMRNKILKASQEYFDAEIILDATGHGGDMFAESLSDIGANVDIEFKYTNKTKNMLMDKLAMFIEKKAVIYPKIPVLVEELKSFTYSFTPSGNVKLGSHKHDDAVNSIALACWKLSDIPLNESFEMNIYNMPIRNFS